MGMMVSQDEDGYGHGHGYVELSSTVEVAIRPIDDDVSDDGSVKFGVPPTGNNSNDYRDDDIYLNFDEAGSNFDYGFHDDEEEKDYEDYDDDDGCPESDNYLADPMYHPGSDEYGDDSREVDDNQDGSSSAAAADLVLGQLGGHHRSHSSPTHSASSQPSTFNSTLSSISDASILSS
ncbi:unnamed protein product, partial [Rotaria sordida]